MREKPDVKIRWLGMVGLCAVGALALTGCDTKIGTAAVVNGSKISDSDVSRYVTSGGDNAGRARNLVLEYQIRQKLFTDALRRKNAVPSDAQLNQLHDLAISNLIGQQVSGGQADQVLRQSMAQNGLSEDFAGVLTRSFETELAYARAINASQEGAVVTDLAKQNIPVSVNPRYGSWDTKTFTFTGLGSKQLPSVVTLNDTLPGDVKSATAQ